MTRAERIDEERRKARIDEAVRRVTFAEDVSAAVSRDRLRRHLQAHPRLTEYDMSFIRAEYARIAREDG